MAATKFFMVWVDATPTTEKRHTTIGSAAKEAERVARQPANIGRKVYILEAMGFCSVEHTPIVWLGL